MSMLRLLAAFILAGSASLPVGAAGAPREAAPTSGTAGYTVPVQATWQIGGAPIAGPDGASYLPVFTASGATYFNGAIERVAQDGSSTALYTFSPLSNADPVTGIGFNSDGEYPDQILLSSDGNFYGSTEGGGASGAGTAFRLTPGGVFTTLHSFDSGQLSGYQIGRSLVQGRDGALYGLTYASGSVPWSATTFFKLALDGTYTSMCSLPLTGNEYVGHLVAGSDGNFYGLLGTNANSTTFSGYIFTGVFKLTPNCGFTQIYSSGKDLTTLIDGGDGNLYAADLGYSGGCCIAQIGATRLILRLTSAGMSTVFHQFLPETYTDYQPGYWSCIKGCVWVPGKWVVNNVDNNANGSAPTSLIRAGDGNLYGTTAAQGLNQYGTVFRITPDGSFTTLLSFPWAVPGGNYPLFEGPDGNPQVLLVTSGAIEFFRLIPDAPLITSISFSRPTVNLWQPTVLSWAFTNAQSCTLIGDVPGVSGTVSASDSKTVRLNSKQNRTPASFVAGIQCTATDGSVSNASATVTIH